MSKHKFKVGDKVKVVKSLFDDSYDCMIGKIVTISGVNETSNSFDPYSYFIKEEYHKEGDPDNEDFEDELLNFFYESELELAIQINPRDLLLKKLK